MSDNYSNDKINFWMGLLFTLFVVPISSKWSYYIGKISDGAWLEVAWFFGLTLGGGWYLYIMFKIFSFDKIQNNRQKMRAKVIIICSILLFFGAKMLGDYHWRQELKENKTIANNVIISLEKYHKENGKYPQSMVELKPTPLLIVKKNGYVDSIRYEVISNDTFRLSFRYGWYQQVYNSFEGQWWAID